VRPLALALALLLPSGLAGAEGTDLHRQQDLEPFSLLDGDTLGSGRLAFAFGAGFPWVQAMAGYNIAGLLDVDLNVDSLYGVATQLSLGPKVRLVRAGPLSLGLDLQGQWAFFRTPAVAESNGARFLTGIRNFGVQPQLILSVKGQYGVLFARAVYQGTFDLEPVTAGPLAGDPGPWSYGSNLGFHLGGELIPNSLVHAYGVVGLDFHTRQGDFPVLPVIELGFSFPI
jgi:hypothetical protein